MNLNEKSLQAASPVSVKYSTGRLDSLPWQNYDEILVIKYVCETAVTSKDLAFMFGMMLAGCEIWQPTGVIYDLTELPYTWGDTMALMFAPPRSEHEALLNEPRKPRVAVVSSLNRPALESLLKISPVPFDVNLLFDDFQTTLASVEARLNLTYR